MWHRIKTRDLAIWRSVSKQKLSSWRSKSFVRCISFSIKAIFSETALHTRNCHLVQQTYVWRRPVINVRHFTWKTGTFLAVCRLSLEGFSKLFTPVVLREFTRKVVWLFLRIKINVCYFNSFVTKLLNLGCLCRICPEYSSPLNVHSL